LDFSELERKPGADELKFFTENPTVGGMADFDTGTVVINPFKQWKPEERNSILTNESMRLFMRKNNVKPAFKLTDEQVKLFSNNRTNTGVDYIEHPAELQETIISRILSGDPSSGKPTPEQLNIAEDLIRLLEERGISGIRRDK